MFSSFTQRWKWYCFQKCALWKSFSKVCVFMLPNRHCHVNEQPKCIKHFLFFGWKCKQPLLHFFSNHQISLKTSGHRGYEFLEFWCWNLVPLLPDIAFQLLKNTWSTLTYFSFNDVPNVHYRWKIWTAGRPIQHPDSSTTKPCCCNSCGMWFCIVLLK